MKMFTGGLREVRLGRLRICTGLYVPYHLFQIEVQNGGDRSIHYLAIDAVTGELDPYSFDEPPRDDEFMELESVQVAPSALSEAETMARLEERIRRGIYLNGFFKVSDLKITGMLLTQFYLACWVGFYVKKDRASIEVIDSVRGQFEGAKVRDLVMTWFQEEAARR
ncbi:MAG TPA: hypothetical protein VNQ79_14710 [Blastocatellia bacterium]|nr:hypothetical protein [Blastocatellia bacterium]